MWPRLKSLWDILILLLKMLIKGKLIGIGCCSLTLQFVCCLGDDKERGRAAESSPEAQSSH